MKFKDSKEFSLKKFLLLPPVFSAAASVIMTVVVESLSRHDFFGGFKFIYEHPQFFILNCLIIFAAMSLTYFSPKRFFTQFMVLFVFFALGVTNFVLLFTRTQPFEAVDISILRTGISIVNVYLNTFEIILIIAAVVLSVAGLVLLCIKTKKQPVQIRYTAVFALISVAVCAACITFYSVFGLIPSNLGDANDAYEKYGFTYCFARSIFDRGISEPEDYSEATVEEILESVGSDRTDKPKTKPNIIMIQLESFMDPSYFKNIEFETDPVPNYIRLKDEGLSGLMSVPNVGSGTANTEFEVLTGMCLDYFGTGEYPYKTILQSRSCETVCYDLAELGYSSHAFHNHTGTFYNRNTAYKNLGFDTFTPVEYMNSYETNPLGWVKDYVLTKQITDALDSTDGRDFVFAVTVQGHGKYPETPVDGEKLIKAEFDGEYSEGYKHQIEYYAYQLWETDDFLGRLISELENYGEKCVVVAYGDHQPSLEYTAEDISLPDKHAGEYVVWANFDMGLTAGERHDLESYQLSAYVLSRLGINNGTITKLHQNYYSNDDYQRALEMLQYDMLYGESYGSEDKYISPDMKMGIRDISVNDVNIIGEDTYIIGRGFTQASNVKINGRGAECIYISDGVLLLRGRVLQDGDSVSIHQITNDFVELGCTDEYIYNADEHTDAPVNNYDTED